jgi:hypothetical protein
VARAVFMTAFAALVAAGCSFDDHGTALIILSFDAGAADAARADASQRPDAGPPFCDETDPTLVACYRFEDPGAPLLDESMYGNDGTVATHLGAVPGPPGHGQALELHPDSVALVPDSVSLNLRMSATLELWVRPTTLPAAGARFGLLDNNGQYGLFLAPDGTVRCAMGSTVPSALSVAPGVWTHIACSYDGQAVRLYQNGALKGTPTATTVTLTDGSADGMRLGENSPTGDVLDGALDDVRIFAVARSAAQICAAAGRSNCPP